MSQLEEREQKLADLRKFVIPAGLWVMVFGIANAINFSVGMSFLPDVLRMLLLPGLAVGMIVMIPLTFKQTALLKEIIALKAQEPADSA